MLVILVLLAAATMLLVLTLLAVVAIGINKEPAGAELASHARSRVTGGIRRLLGVSVRKLDHAEGPGLTGRDLTDVGVR